MWGISKQADKKQCSILWTGMQTKNSAPFCEQERRQKAVLHSVNRNAIPSHSIHQCHKERPTQDALKRERRCHADTLGRMTQRHQEQNAAARGTYKQPEDERRGIKNEWKHSEFFFLSQISKCNKIYQLNTGNALWSQLHLQTFT